MGDLKARLIAKFSRRSSTAGSFTSAHSEPHRASQRDEAKSLASGADTESVRAPASRASQPSPHHPSQNGGDPLPPPSPSPDIDVKKNHHRHHLRDQPGRIARDSGSGGDHHQAHVVAPRTTADGTATATTTALTSTTTTAASSPLVGPSHDSERVGTTSPSDAPGNDLHPSSTTSTTTATSNASNLAIITEHSHNRLPAAATAIAHDSDSVVDVLLLSSPASARPPPPPRRQSLLPHRQTSLIRTLLDATQAAHHQDGDDLTSSEALLSINANMVTRKVWVKRPGASATLITVNEEDLVDDVRDMILRKYTNSLGKQFDAPDLTLRIVPREQRQDRTLGPEEPLGRTLDAYFPGGQTVDEALIIDIPKSRTPRPSPRAHAPHAATVYFAAEDGRPSEAGEGYFPPVVPIPSPSLPVPVVAQVVNGHPHPAHAPHSIAVLGTGQIPPIPSPGGTRSRTYGSRPQPQQRPTIGRTHTSSPTIISTGSAQPAAAPAAHPAHPSFHPRLPPSRTHSNASEPTPMQPAPPIVPSPSPQEPPQPQRVATPPPRVASPRPSSTRPKKTTKKVIDHPVLPPGMLNGGVPPINVLIVEDNPINLKLLEAFVKRLKVRWKTAIDGRDAVKKWKTGGFHLVLMDIQLPVMNGLDATREIRRLERVNSIGVFSSSAASEPETTNGEVEEHDRLQNIDMFKSPVIIVALTASSLQSDRHQALAAGCNDFLTKPVNFVWLERKVMEWGCMQALIDFDGWRKWKDFSQDATEDAPKKASASKSKAKKSRISVTTAQA